MKYRNQKERNKKRAEKTAETREQRALSSKLTCCCDNKVSAVPYKEFAVFGLKINLHVKRRRSVWDAKGTPGELRLQRGDSAQLLVLIVAIETVRTAASLKSEICGS